MRASTATAEQYLSNPVLTASELLLKLLLNKSVQFGLVFLLPTTVAMKFSQHQRFLKLLRTCFLFGIYNIQARIYIKQVLKRYRSRPGKLLSIAL